MNGLKIRKRGEAGPPVGEAGNKWLFLVIVCGVLIGLVIFRIFGYQREKKELVTRLSQALQEKDALNSQIKEVQNTRSRCGRRSTI